MLEAFFPNGISQYLIGGILIGLSVALIYIPTAYIVGASAVLSSIFSFFSKIIPNEFRTQRIIHFVGVIIGAALFSWIFADHFITTVPLWRLIVGGFLVGLGAKLARGCTSGHGVCGLGSLAKSSIVYVFIFMVVAICTATILGAIL